MRLLLALLLGHNAEPLLEAWRLEIEYEARQTQRQAAVGDFHNALQFLSDVWKDQFYDILQERSTLQRATIIRWLRGGAPAAR